MGAATVTLRAADADAAAPWRWMTAGWRDLRRAWPMSLAYGAVFVAAGLAITVGLLRVGWGAAIPAAVGGFALAGPVMAAGLYEISRRLEAGEPLSWRAVFFVKTAAPGQLAFLAALLVVALLAWARTATLLFALFAYGRNPTIAEFSQFALATPNGLAMLTVGAAVGGLIAFGVFSCTALAAPILMHRQVDAFTAMAASIQAVRARPKTMLVWAWIVAVTVALGAAFALVGLVVAFPLLGHATWHAYRAMIDDPA